jgi:hypothetical protein
MASRSLVSILMSNRESLLGNLSTGDIFHAEYPNGAKCICLVLTVTDATIQARRITSQEDLEFDRQNGMEKVVEGEPLAVITSVAPLPIEIHNVFLELDRKYRAVRGQKDIVQRHPEYFKLTDAEKKAFLSIHDHCASNLLPPA